MCLGPSDTQHRATAEHSLVVKTQSDSPQWSVNTGPVKQPSGRLEKHHETNMQGIQGDHIQKKNLRADLTFLVKILSDFTELPIAKKKKKKVLLVLCFLSDCLCVVCVPVCECTCMHVCLHMFPGMHGKNRGDQKEEEGSVGHWLM